MSNVMQHLHDIGLNPFAVQLLAESMLKSPVAALSTEKPLSFFYPVSRGDCPGWVGVRITIEAVRPACGCRDGECESKADHECRMTLEIRQKGHQ